MNSKPHIFLDIDGVLALDFEMNWSNPKKWNEKMNTYGFNKKAVKVFNDICVAVDPVIILSSDWRLQHEMEALNEFFEWNGLTYKITDYTSNFWKIRFKSLQELEECRAAEINLYVQEKELTNWVAIDDLDLSPWIPNNLVQTPKSNEGIKQSGVKDKIINILLN